jgi:hypothetical protein
MIVGAKYALQRPKDTILGWKIIQLVERREVGVVTVKTKDGTRQYGQYQWIALGDSEPIVLDEAELFEELSAYYTFLEVVVNGAAT